VSLGAPYFLEFSAVYLIKKLGTTWSTYLILDCMYYAIIIKDVSVCIQNEVSKIIFMPQTMEYLDAR
jgi:hypothetical protein